MLASLTPDRLTMLARRAWLWWAREIKALVPAGLHAARGRTGSRLVLARGVSGFALLEERGGCATLIDEAGFDSSDPIGQLALRLGRERTRTGWPGGVRLGRGECLLRELTLPAAGRRRLEAMLAVDLERTLPASSAPVVWAWRALPHPELPDRLRAEQIVAKRPLVEGLLQKLAEAGVEPDFVEGCGADGQAVAINLLDGLDRGTVAPASRRIMAGLAAAALLAAVAAPALAIVRTQWALEGLEASIEEAKAAAIAVRGQLDRKKGIQSAAAALSEWQGSRPRALEIWREVTRLLPDDAYAEELVIEKDTVSIAGKARKAAPLVTIVESSPLLAGASLTAPVVLDAESGLEHFSLSARLASAPAAEVSQ